ncbi:MAG: hypothetical protein ACO1ON_13180 [Nocardioides sp.]
MAGRLGHHRGGIAGLLTLLDEHQEAIEYDLLTVGLRLDWLGTERLSWRDLLVIIRQSPRTSAYARAIHGDEALWGLSDHLLAEVVDALAWANWQRAGQRYAPKPKPIPRPGRKGKTQRVGSEPLPIAELDTWIATAEAA